MNLFEEKPNPIDSVDTLINQYKLNCSQIESLNLTQDLIKNQVVRVMRQTQTYPFMFNKEFYTKANKYLKKEIKRGEDGYKESKEDYDYILYVLQNKVSSDIKKIDKFIERVGYNYNLISENVCFTLNGNEFELHIPYPQNISLDDVFMGDYINTYADKFTLFARTSNSSITCIWHGADISKIKDEVDFTKNYREYRKNDNKESK